MVRCALWLIVALSALSPSARADGWSVQTWTLDDGLPVNGLTDLAQTADGFLWVASSGGLVRFDGSSFQRVGGALTNARLTQIAVGADGRLYAATHTNRLFSLGDGRITAHPQHIYGFDQRPDGLWIGGEGGVWRVTSRGLLRVGAPIDRPVVTGIVDGRGRLWFGLQTGELFRQTPRGAVRVPLPGTGGGPVHTMHLDGAGRLWVGASPGLFVIDGDRVRRVPLPGCAHDQVMSLTPDGPDGLLLGTTCGPWRLDGEVARPLAAHEVARQIHQQVLRLSTGALAVGTADGVRIEGERVFDRPVTRQLEARDGALWLTTSDGVLARIRRRPIERLGGADGRCNGYGMHQDRAGDVWVACLDRGLLRFRDGRPVPVEPRAWAGVMTTTVFEDHTGRIWSGDPSLTGRLEVSAVLSVFEDAQGTLWVGAHEGLFRRDGDDFRPVPLADGRPIGRVVATLADPTGLWIASQTLGLVRLEGGRPTAVYGREAGLPTIAIRDVSPASDGGLWLSTEDRGLVHARISGGRVAATRIGPEHGLHADHVHRMLDDGRGRRWMNSNTGIFWVPEAELLDVVAGRRARVGSVVYGTLEGLPHREGNGGSRASGLRLRDGRLAFPTQEGVALIDPRTIERDGRAPQVHIEQLVASERVATGPVTLEPDERDFEVTYTAPVFHHPERVRFRYRLEGFDTRWVEAGTRRRAIYTQVPPGRYRFVVTAANADHVWNLEGAALDIVVRPRFYETWWFAGLCALGVLGLIAGAVRLRFAAMKARARHLEEQVALRTAELARQAEALEALDELKTRFFAHISHELRTPLTLIAGAVERIEGEAPDNPAVEALRRNTRRLRRLTDQILGLLRGEAGIHPVTLRPLDLAALAHATVHAFAPVAEQRTFAVRGEGVALAHPDHIETVLVNLVSNAVKFTAPGGRIVVHIERAGQWAQLTVEDDGRGIPAADVPRIFDRFYRVESETLRAGEGTGLGLALVRALVEQQGGRVGAESQPGEGSRFTVELLAVDGPAHPWDWGQQGHSEADLLHAPTLQDDADDGRPRVLVVDDNAELRRFVGEVLAPDYAVSYAADGEEGLARARAELPDVVVADLMMPRLDGIGLVRGLLDDPETACIPVLLLTARVGEDVELHGLESGAAIFMTKPFNKNILKAHVRGLFDRRTRLRDALRAELASAPPDAPVTPTADAPAPEPTTLEQARTLIEARIDDPDLDLPSLARSLGMSKATLARRLQAEDAPSPGALIREVRLERAHALLVAGRGNVSEVAFAVGFNSHAQFSRRFKTRYGVPPSALKPDT